MDKPDVQIKPATRHDIAHFFDDKMRDTCRAWSAFLNGELAAIGGVAITRNLMLVFMQTKPGIKVSKRIYWQAALKIWDKIKALEYPLLYAVADPKLSTAPVFLEHLGFEHKESSVRGEIYRWEIR